MKRRTFILTAATLGLGALAATTALAHDQGMGQGQGQGGYHGQMGGHGHHGMKDGNCQQGMGQALDTPLKVEDATAMMQRKLDRRANPRLKLGSVVQSDDNTITAEIVTQDGSLVDKFAIDRNTGRWTRVND